LSANDNCHVLFISIVDTYWKENNYIIMIMTRADAFMLCYLKCSHTAACGINVCEHMRAFAYTRACADIR